LFPLIIPAAVVFSVVAYAELTAMLINCTDTNQTMYQRKMLTK